MYGSSLHLCGFKHSDLNISIQIQNSSMKAPDCLTYVKEALKTSGKYVDKALLVYKVFLL